MIGPNDLCDEADRVRRCDLGRGGNELSVMDRTQTSPTIRHTFTDQKTAFLRYPSHWFTLRSYACHRDETTEWILSSGIATKREPTRIDGILIDIGSTAQGGIRNGDLSFCPFGPRARSGFALLSPTRGVHAGLSPRVASRAPYWTSHQISERVVGLRPRPLGQEPASVWTRQELQPLPPVAALASIIRKPESSFLAASVVGDFAELLRLSRDRAEAD